MDRAPILSFNKLSYTLKNGQHILDNISCDIERGDFIVLIGANGSGKSTLLKTLAGINRQYSGTILYKGKKVSESAYHNISFIEQGSGANLCINMSIYENYQLFCRNSMANNKDAAKSYLQAFDKTFAMHLDKPVNKLSGGQKQKLTIALYLLMEQEILLLDEYTSALDPKTGKMILDMTAEIIKSRGITCVMIIHSLSDALYYGNKLIALKEGQLILKASPAKKARLKKEKLLELCY